MGLLTETNEQYYAGQQSFTTTPAQVKFTWTGDTNLVATVTGVSYANFEVYKNGVLLTPTTEYTLSENAVTLIGAAIPTTGDAVVIKLLTSTVWANNGNYSYISLKDVINNFMVAYVGMDKLIPRIKRSDVMFHAKRGLQEFSYDTLKSIKSQELTIPPSLSIIIPQDYVNYVEMSRIDDLGVKHVIYPTTLTSNPYTVPVQDANGVPTQNDLGENVEGTSQTNERWDTANDNLLTGAYDNEMYNAGVYNWTWDKVAYGRRYGLDPETSQTNGWFTINDREGKFSFSSNLAGQLIILEYISDGLSVDYDMKIPKMAEEAIYMHIAYSILASRVNMPEYIVQRYKKDRRAALRNAKIRLSEIKLNQFVQVMRNKSKWIKH
tara:strand:- start:23 stop:1159 length:1137 start_codon:yes stop_codon:yes gene_type:complete